MTYKLSSCRQRGSSLIELMVAMVIGLVIILGASQLFMSGLQNFRQAEMLGDKQAALTFVTDVIMRQIRRGEFSANRYEFRDSEDGESCTFFDTVHAQPIVDGLSKSDENDCGGKLDAKKDVDGIEGLYRVSLSLEGERTPFNFYVMNRTVATDNGNGGYGKVADSNNPGYYNDGSRMYESECYNGGGKFKPNWCSQ